MKDTDEGPASPRDEAQQQPVPDTPWLTERLTEAEIEALRQDQNEAIAYVKKVYYPDLRIQRAGEDSTEGPKQ